MYDIFLREKPGSQRIKPLTHTYVFLREYLAPRIKYATIVTSTPYQTQSFYVWLKSMVYGLSCTTEKLVDWLSWQRHITDMKARAPAARMDRRYLYPLK